MLKNDLLNSSTASNTLHYKLDLIDQSETLCKYKVNLKNVHNNKTKNSSLR